MAWRPQIVFIGAGNLATRLSLALHQAGFPIVQVYSRTEASARTLAESLKTDWTTCLEQVRGDAALYVVALKDTALVELLPQIVAGRNKALFVHTAGSVPADIWKSVGVSRYGVFYPMQTFSKKRAVDFQKIPIFIEASNAADTEHLRQVGSAISGHVQEATSAQRQALHLAAVFANNFTNHCYAITAELLKQHGLSFEVMLPLIDETAQKVHDLDPLTAQTGPAVRYDTNVIQKQLQLLADQPELQSLYRLMSESIHAWAKKK